MDTKPEKQKHPHGPWVRKLQKYAELESWSEIEKLVQLELRLKGRAKHLFKVLPKESKSSFSSAVESLKKRLALARRDALLSAQLMKGSSCHHSLLTSMRKNLKHFLIAALVIDPGWTRNQKAC